MANRFFVTGTDTGVGKTVVSALLCASLDAIYWKPIQTGSREGTDRGSVMHFAELPATRTIPEIYKFTPPVSPHLAARQAGIHIDLTKVKWPGEIVARQPLIVEGAGGVLVPLNEHRLMTHLMKRLHLPIVLVSRTSLGTINHTLLSLAALRSARLDVRGIVMVGQKNDENRKAIEHYGRAQVIGWVPALKRIDRSALLHVFKKHFHREAFSS